MTRSDIPETCRRHNDGLFDAPVYRLHDMTAEEVRIVGGP